MVAVHSGVPTPAAGWRWVYRLIVPAAALSVYGVLAALWHWGPSSLYFGALQFVGIEPFRIPFLDIQAILSAAECQRLGLDVYLSNPCDALGRPHVYSPLWLVVTPGFLDTRAAMGVGLTLDLLFILSLALVIRPTTRGEILVLALAALSPTTVYALERANSDLIVYLLVVSAWMLDLAPRRYRLGAYALYLTAGLLKYYPLALLALVARERWRDALVIAGTAGSTVVLLAVYDYAELGKALANLPTLSYFSDSFSALNLPFGFAEALAGYGPRSVLGLLLLSLLVAVAIARTRRTLRLLDPGTLDWEGREAQCLVAGALLLMACFFAGQNVDYRGVYFVLVVPGLVHLHRSSRETAVRQFGAQMIAAALFLMWEEFFRRALHTLVSSAPSEGLSLPEVYFWIGRELVWWWLVAGLAAIVLLYFRQLPLARDSIAKFRHCRALLKIIGKWGSPQHSPDHFR
jgi:hypothetical protein